MVGDHYVIEKEEDPFLKNAISTYLSPSKIKSTNDNLPQRLSSHCSLTQLMIKTTWHLDFGTVFEQHSFPRKWQSCFMNAWNALSEKRQTKKSLTPCSCHIRAIKNWLGHTYHIITKYTGAALYSPKNTKIQGDLTCTDTEFVKEARQWKTFLKIFSPPFEICVGESGGPFSSVSNGSFCSASAPKACMFSTQAGRQTDKSWGWLPGL